MRPAKAEVGPDHGDGHTWRWKESTDERTTTWRKIAMTSDEIEGRPNDKSHTDVVLTLS